MLSLSKNNSWRILPSIFALNPILLKSEFAKVLKRSTLITHKTGNLLEASAEALVNTVKTEHLSTYKKDLY